MISCVLLLTAIFVTEVKKFSIACSGLFIFYKQKIKTVPLKINDHGCPKFAGKLFAHLFQVFQTNVSEIAWIFTLQFSSLDVGNRCFDLRNPCFHPYIHNKDSFATTVKFPDLCSLSLSQIWFRKWL